MIAMHASLPLLHPGPDPARPLAATLVAVLLLAGCSGKSALPPPPPATTPHDVTLTAAQRKDIHTVTVEPADYRPSLTTTGVVDFDHDRTVDIVAPFSGAVIRVPATLGAHVHKGQVLATVESPDYMAAAGAYRKAVLAAQAADAVAANDRALSTRQAIPARENADAQTTAAGADADLASALKALLAMHVEPGTIAALRAGRRSAVATAPIRAPINGTVVAKSLAPGQTIAAGSSPCFTIADTTRLWVIAQVFGAAARRVQDGDPATVDTNDGGAMLTGTVTNVGAIANAATGAAAVRISVVNPASTLRKQMYVSVHIQSRRSRRGLLVPVSAVLRDDENLPFVYVVTPAASYARRPVTLGARIADRFVIPAGLRAGDRVVVDGGLFLAFIQSQ